MFATIKPLEFERLALNLEKAKIGLALQRGDFLRVRTCANNAIEIQQRINVLEAQDFGMRRVNLARV
jgi:hypothetical protein